MTAVLFDVPMPYIAYTFVYIVDIFTRITFFDAINIQYLIFNI